MMPTQDLFLITVLYLIQRWGLSLFNRQSSIEPLRAEECIVFLRFMDTWRWWKQALDVLAEDYPVIALCRQKHFPQCIFCDPGIL